MPTHASIASHAFGARKFPTANMLVVCGSSRCLHSQSCMALCYTAKSVQTKTAVDRLVAIADRSLYCTSKGAIVQLTREFAVKWARAGLKVNAICPGPFETEMNQVLTEAPETKDAFAAHTAMRRWGRMDEIEAAVLLLAAETRGYVTSAMIPVDGGWPAQ